jgi:hypothetical protein
MTARSNDPRPGFSRSRQNIFTDLRQHNERRVDVAQLLEARRLRQIERVMQTARNARTRERPS